MCVHMYATPCGRQEVAPGRDVTLSSPHESKDLSSSHGLAYLLIPLVGPDVQILRLSLRITLPAYVAQAGLEP